MSKPSAASAKIGRRIEQVIGAVRCDGSSPSTPVEGSWAAVLDEDKRDLVHAADAVVRHRYEDPQALETSFDDLRAAIARHKPEEGKP